MVNAEQTQKRGKRSKMKIGTGGTRMEKYNTASNQEGIVSIRFECRKPVVNLALSPNCQTRCNQNINGSFREAQKSSIRSSSIFLRQQIPLVLCRFNFKYLLTLLQDHLKTEYYKQSEWRKKVIKVCFTSHVYE